LRALVLASTHAPRRWKGIPEGLREPRPPDAPPVPGSGAGRPRPLAHPVWRRRGRAAPGQPPARRPTAVASRYARMASSTPPTTPSCVTSQRPCMPPRHPGTPPGFGVQA